MPSFSTTLEQAIHGALALANARRHELATLEHLLLSLIDEPDAARVMKACSVDLDDLRNFTTPEIFAAARLELQERGTAPQTTDVVKVDAEVLDVAEEDDKQIVSVRFHGLIREERESAASDFDEIWHLVKPLDDSRSWAIAGIQQR